MTNNIPPVPVDGRARTGRKSQILDVSTALFRRKGYHATSLDDIAEEIGFTKPAIYYYFGSKEDILFAIVDEIVDRALERITEIAERDDTPTQKLHDLLVANTRAVLESLDGNTVFYNERGLLSPEREQEIHEREREYTQVIRQIYVDGVEAGEFVDLPPTIATSTLLGASIWSYRWFDVDGARSSDEIAEDIAGLLMNGYLRR